MQINATRFLMADAAFQTRQRTPSIQREGFSNNIHAKRKKQNRSKRNRFTSPTHRRQKRRSTCDGISTNRSPSSFVFSMQCSIKTDLGGLVSARVHRAPTRAFAPSLQSLRERENATQESINMRAAHDPTQSKRGRKQILLS